MCMCKIGFELDKNGVRTKHFEWLRILCFIILTAFDLS